MARVTGTLIALLIFMVGAVLLQIFLSRRESRWPGLVLPGVCFLFSMAAVLSVAALGSLAESIATILLVLVLYNLPTMVLLAIYFACREKFRKRREVEKMNIADL